MSEDVILAHADLESVCEHIHLPLQSGSSRILKAMRRTYDRGRYMDRVALIREHVPDCALTTDIIVGFPGETEADFEETLQVAEEVGYDGAFTFIYSPRRGTEAATFTEDFVPHEVAVERMERLVEVVQRRARERAQRFVGRTLDVLVEGSSRTDAEPRPRPHHATTRSSTSTASPHRGRSSRSRSPPPRARRSPARCRCSPAPADARFRPSPACANICSCAGNHRASTPTTTPACRASARTSSSAASTRRRRSTPASTRSGPSPRSTASQPSRASRSSGR